MTNEVIASTEGAAGRITLNRPEALHALNEDMCLAIYDALKDWRADPDVKLVILDHAPNTRGFCAGGDIRMLAESGQGTGQAARDFFRAEYRLNTLMHNYEKPIIAFQDGITMGGGVGISVHGSHRVATENTVFAMPETGIGLFPDVGGGWFLPRLPHGPALGMWLALTGERLKGADNVAAGVSTHFMKSDVIDAVKQSLYEGELELLEAMDWDESAPFEDHLGVMEACFTKASVEQIFDALGTHTSDWAKTQLATLKTKSPQTLKVAHRQLVEGAKLETFEDNMRMEFRIGARVIHRHDFAEGVRAVIIDKDNKPDWDPVSLLGVTEEILDDIFAPLPADEELTFD